MEQAVAAQGGAARLRALAREVGEAPASSTISFSAATSQTAASGSTAASALSSATSR